MRDIPAFTTENGAASLVLSQIPTRKTAFIVVQSSLAPQVFLEECARFCRMAGAEQVYARGEGEWDAYPLYTAVVAMERGLENLPDTDAKLVPLTEGELPNWLEIYSERMKRTPLAAYMTAEDGKKLLETGSGFFVHKNGQCIGIGIASGDTLRAVASVKRGAGRDVVLALCRALSGERVLLEVADRNAPAMELYRRLGFRKKGEIARWYEIPSLSRKST